MKEGRGRRVSTSLPDRSLILTKPSGRLPHGGGRRLPEESTAWHLLAAWIEAGTPGPAADDPSITSLTVTPGELVLQPGGQSPLKVQATWSDGVSRAVNQWALFDSADDNVVSVSPQGLVEVRGPGRTSVTVRYLQQVVAVTVTVPYGPSGGSADWVAHNLIDEHIAREWEKVGVKPAGLAGDEEFLRRATLDITGRLPTPEEVRRFSASTEPAKREQLIDQLLDRPEYVDRFALKWSDLLRGHRRFLGEKGLWSFYSWIRRQIRENRPADQTARELLTASGNLYSNGAVAFYYVDQTPLDLAETTSQIFLGVRLQCARCHHHPFEVWSQEDYYSLAACFSRVERKDSGENGQLGGLQAVQLAPTGTLQHPETGKVMQPALFGQPLTGGDSSTAGSTVDLRIALAEEVTSPANRWFARNLVNRYWHHFFGRGLVMPVDDLRESNPASHPALFEALAGELVARRYDLKQLIRLICTSRTYQLASEIAPARDRDGMFYTHIVPRRLPAEVLLDAINQAAGTAEEFPGLPPGFRAVELPDSDIPSYFLETFGRPERTTTCSCDRSNSADLKQALHLINGGTLQEKIVAKDNRLAQLLASDRTDAEIIAELYLAVLSRRPTDEEAARALKFVEAAPSRQEGFEDLLWTLFNFAEFLFQH